MRAQNVWRAGVMVAVLVGLGSGPSASGATAMVEGGRPQADIVIAARPARMTTLAAEELQTYIEKITGARLPITSAPGEGAAVHIYVGRSSHTDRLKVSDEGLESGAFRMLSGTNWLALVGHDSDFVVRGPFHAGGALTTNSPALIEWDKLTGKKWGFPMSMLSWEYNGALKAWEQDERGSLNAVYEFLRMQGVRWYLPGELGEIVPRKMTIVLPPVDKTVRPDFRLRVPYQYSHMFGRTTREEVLWQLRLGIYSGPDPVVGGAHGLRNVQGRSEMRQAHPEYYALYDGKRDRGRPCLSSEGLFRETVAYVRAMVDIYDATIVSVMPEDGYIGLCQCDLCKGKGTPELGWTGQISDYVWDFVNRVAKEVYKTHPDRKVTCAAYGAYLVPPAKIEKLNPNVVVTICQWRSDFQDPKVREEFVKLREGWLKKLPPSGLLGINDYYLHGRPNMPWDGVPVFFPRLIAQDLHSLKGISVGEFIETYRDFGESLRSLAVLHLNLYVTSRFWWDADQSVDALLDEYYTLFYGPARDEMKAFIEYCEGNWSDMTKNGAKIARVFELLGKAQQEVAADSVYGKRIALIADFIQPMKALQEQLSRVRPDVPALRAYSREKAGITLDGKLDEEFWAGIPWYPLSETQTGREPVSPSGCKIAWAGDNLYVGIRCTDSDMAHLNVGSTSNEDPAIWSGDHIELLLETQTHCYYQVVISPSGAIADLDRKQGRNALWESGATAVSQFGDGYWTLEICVPVPGQGQEAIDPLHGVSGRVPGGTYPWYLNVGRQRVRKTGTELSALSPTGKPTFDEPLKFGKLFVR